MLREYIAQRRFRSDATHAWNKVIAEASQPRNQPAAIALRNRTKRCSRIRQRKAGIPAMMNHLHPKGPREWGSGRIITQLVDCAWEEGLEVYINMHSYEAYDENIILVPRWALVSKPVQGLGQYDANHPDADYTNLRENLDRRLSDPDLEKIIRKDIAYEIDRQGGPDGLLIMDYPDKSWVGKTLAQVSRERGEDPVDTALYIQERIRRAGRDQAPRVRGCRFSISRSS